MPGGPRLHHVAQLSRDLPQRHGRLHSSLSQGLHATGFGDLGPIGNNERFLAQAVVMTPKRDALDRDVSRRGQHGWENGRKLRR
jgi:hypothetical protein